MSTATQEVCYVCGSTAVTDHVSADANNPNEPFLPVCDAHPWGDPAEQYARVTEAIDAMAERLAGIDTGEVFSSFTCGEIESVAQVLRVAGHDDTADFIIREHALGDDEGDEHGGQS